MSDPGPPPWPAPVGPPVTPPAEPSIVRAEPWGEPPVAPVRPPTWPGGPAPVDAPRPSAAGYLIGVAIAVVGGAVAVVWFIALIASGTDGGSFPHAPVPGERRIDLQAQPYTLYDEYPGSTQQVRRAPVVRITGPNGAEAITATPTDQTPESYVTYVDGLDHPRAATGFATIRPTVAGTYLVEVRSDSLPGETAGTEQVTIGPALSAENLGAFLGSVALGALTFVIGAVIVVVTAVRRRRPAGERVTPPA